MWRRPAAKLLLRFLHSAMMRNTGEIDPILADAFQMQCGRLDPEEFRARLDDFYRSTTSEKIQQRIGFDRHREQLIKPDAYKVEIMNWDSGTTRVPLGMDRLWSRRFALLRHLGVRCDVLVLRAGEEIPPHGHSRVISGFYVLDGKVAFRHFDRVRMDGKSLLVRKTVDGEFGPGDYSTNSEFHDNIHWLAGISEMSFLFRFTATGVPGPTFGDSKQMLERVYLDPSGSPDAAGLISARFIEAQEARSIRMR